MSNASTREVRGLRVTIAFIILAIASGTWLRSYQLGTQLIIDDEWHAVHKLLRAGYVDIATHVGFADYSIPLTLYFRFLHDHGGLSEWGMHLLPLLAGCGVLVCGPLLLRRWLDSTALAAWVMLIAISPLLVYLSKTARPYALTGLLSLIAIVAFRRWWHDGDHSQRWGAAYVASASAAAYLHLITAPYTLLPFVYYGAKALNGGRRAEDRFAAIRELRRLVLLGIVTLLVLTLLLLPPLWVDWAQFAAKAGTDVVTIDSVYRTLLMLCGTSSPWVLAALSLLALAGAFRLFARDPDLVGYLVVVIIGGTMAIAIAKPAWIQHAPVLARYAVPALSLLAVFVATGASWILASVRSAPLRLALLALAGSILFASGPLPPLLVAPNQFFGHLRYQFDYDDRENPYVQLVPPDPLPVFYQDLAQRPPGSVTLVEAPWRLESNFNPHPWYQQVHRQWVRIGLVTPVCGERDFGEFPESPSMRFRNFAHLSSILRGEATGAQYLVLHRRAWKTPPDAGVEWPDMNACIERAAASLGPAMVDDGQIVVFKFSH